MAVEIDVEYLGSLKTRATHGPSGSTMMTVAPKDNQGDGSTFSPTDLVATALATCVITTMAIAAKKHGLDLPGAAVHVEKHMSQDSPRRIIALPVTVRVAAGVPQELRERLEGAARACPVAASLRSDIEAPVLIEWS